MLGNLTTCRTFNFLFLNIRILFIYFISRSTFFQFYFISRSRLTYCKKNLFTVYKNIWFIPIGCSVNLYVTKQQ